MKSLGASFGLWFSRTKGQGNLTAVVTHKRETNAKNLAIKIMRHEIGKATATESDPNK